MTHPKITRTDAFLDLAADVLLALGYVALILAAVVIFLTLGVLWIAHQAGRI